MKLGVDCCIYKKKYAFLVINNVFNKKIVFIDIQ